MKTLRTCFFQLINYFIFFNIIFKNKFLEIFILSRFGFNPHDIFIEHEEFNDDTIQSIGEGHFGCVYRFFSFNYFKYKVNITSIERNLNGHLETVAVKSIRLLMGGFDSVSAFRQRLKDRARIRINSTPTLSEAILESF